MTIRSARRAVPSTAGISTFTPVAVPLGALLAWTVLAAAVPSIVASPSAAWSAIVVGFERGWVMDGLTATLLATGFAFAVSASLGVLLGSLLASSRFWGDVWEPVLFWLYGIPKLIFYPIVILVFGIGFSSTMAFGVLSGLLPVVIIVFASVRSVPLMHLKVAKVYGLSRRQVFREVVVPVVLPSLVTAVRYGFSLAFSGVVLAEMFAAREGLGQVLMGAMFIANKGQLFGVAAVLVVVGFGVNGLLLLVQRRVAMRFGGLATAGQRL